MTTKEINGKIQILSSYNDLIRIAVRDQDSGTVFLEMELTREQFINAAMNRLADCDVKKTEVRDLDRVGKKMVTKSLSFEVREFNDEEEARREVKVVCPDGWIPDMGFNTQTSFYSKDGKRFAKTLIRQWVEP